MAIELQPGQAMQLMHDVNLMLVRDEAPDLNLDRLALPFADHFDRHLLADGRVGNNPRQTAHVLDLATVEPHDYIARLES